MKRPSWRTMWKGWRTIRNARAQAIQDLGGDSFARYYIGRHLKLFRDGTPGATPEHVAAYLAAEVVMWKQHQERQRVNDHIREIGR